MKRIISLLFAVSAVVFSAAAEGLSERVYISTDRGVYVSGDRVWCSAFCMDASTGGFSDFSSIAYLELHSSAGMVHTAKIALLDGRGAGVMQLPSNLPTGNYKLLAYTKQNRNEDGYDYSASAKVISVFNPNSSARVEGGVRVVESMPAAQTTAPDAGGLSIKVPAGALSGQTVELGLSCPQDATLSISVSHDDGIIAPAGISIADFKGSLKPGTAFTYNFVPEYEGEIINGRVTGLSPSQLDSLAGYAAFISAPGDIRDVYSSGLDADGRVSFYTTNIYGDRDLVCEIENLGSGMPGHIELDSPFAEADAGDVPVLEICPGMRPLLERRAAAVQIERLFSADTLYEYLPKRENLLTGDEYKSYLLDDYTRFPTMEEVLVEYVSEMRIRRNGKVPDIQVKLTDLYSTARFSYQASLMMVDEVPVFDPSKIISYDPLLVRELRIYPCTYSLGFRVYEGIADFRTYKGNLPAVDFDANVRIVDFHGPSYPMAYTCGTLVHDGRYPDYRQTAYWHPILEVEAGRTKTVEVVLPSYPGRFTVKVEGIASDGAPVSCITSFEVQ